MRIVLLLFLSLLTAADARASGGNFDNAFNGTGVWVVDFSALQSGYSARYAAMAVDAQERITLAVKLEREDVASTGLGLARLLPDGKLDPSFGSQGIARVPLLDLERVVALKIDAAGRVYLALQLRTGLGRTLLQARAGTGNARRPAFGHPRDARGASARRRYLGTHRRQRLGPRRRALAWRFAVRQRLRGLRRDARARPTGRALPAGHRADPRRHVLAAPGASFQFRSHHRNRAMESSSAASVLRNLLPISAAILLGWVVFDLVATRLSFLQGPTVIGQYDREFVTSSSGDRSRWRGFVRYRVPDDWPVDAGQMRRAALPGFSRYDPTREVGADTQLKLSRTAPDEAMEWSFYGFWLVPVIVVFFGSGGVLCLAAAVPGPGGGLRLPGVSSVSVVRFGEVRFSDPRMWIGELAAAVVFVLFLTNLRRALLLMGLLFVALTVYGIVISLYGILRRSRAAPGPDFDGSGYRPGVAGFVVDVLQHAGIAICLTGLCAASIVAFVRGLDSVVDKNDWSSNTVNTLRTVPWLPQDFDRALCEAADRKDVAALQWLLAGRARAQVVCAAGSPPITSAAHFEQPGTIGLDAQLYAAVDDYRTDAERVRALLSSGANPNTVRDGRHVLALAALKGRGDVVKRLLEAGADPNHPVGDGETVLTEIVGPEQVDRTLNYLPLLLARGGDLNHRGKAGRSILLQHCMNARTIDLDFVGGLMVFGADPNLADATGRTALDYLYEQKADRAIEVFEAHGARRSKPPSAATR